MTPTITTAQLGGTVRFTDGDSLYAPAAEAEDRFVIRDRNRAAIFTTILTQGPISRVELARRTGLSQATITKSVKPMLDHGYVVEGPDASGGRGRPAIPLRINPGRHHVVGVKLAPDHVAGVVTDLSATVLRSRRGDLPDRRPESVVRSIAALTEELLAEAPDEADRVIGLGVGLGGHVDRAAGMVRRSTRLQWEDQPLAQMLETATGLRTHVENDVNALTVAEQWFGAGRGVPWFAVVTVGVGIGCGLVLDGRLVHGAHGAAGELGHVVVEPDGAPCNCGSTGCLETIASDAAILSAIRGGGREVADMAEATDLARRGDAAAQKAFARAGRAIGLGMASIVNLVNPSRIVLSGEGVVASDLLVDAMKEAMEAHTFASVATECEVVTRPLPDDTWARGAAATVLEELFVSPLRAARQVAG